MSNKTTTKKVWIAKNYGSELTIKYNTFKKNTITGEYDEFEYDEAKYTFEELKEVKCDSELSFIVFADNLDEAKKLVEFQYRLQNLLNNYKIFIDTQNLKDFRLLIQEESQTLYPKKEKEYPQLQSGNFQPQ